MMKINVKVNAQRNHLKLHAKWPGNLNCPGVLETSRQESWQIEIVHFSRPNLKHDFMPSCHTPQAAFPSNWHKYGGYDADRNHRCGLEMSVYCLWFDIIKGSAKVPIVALFHLSQKWNSITLSAKGGGLGTLVLFSMTTLMMMMAIMMEYLRK